MYYLLRNNLIVEVDNEKYFLQEKGEQTETIFGTEYSATPYVYERKKYYNSQRGIRHVVGYVLKCSENIMDLINEGDLVKLIVPEDYAHMYSTPFDICFVDKYLKEDLDIAGKYDELLLAIYKQNGKGDFVKSWEKEV